jgi:hypothetical protein
MQDLITRTLRGFKFGLAFAGAYCSIATVIFLIGGAAPFRANHSSFLDVLGMYLVGGATIGVITGILQPLAATRPGAGIVGFVGAFPLGFLVAMGTAREFETSKEHLEMALFFSITMGIPGGLILREILLADRESKTGKTEEGERKT